VPSFAPTLRSTCLALSALTISIALLVLVGTWWLSVLTIVALSGLLWRVASRLSQCARERDALQAELQRLGDHDPLTGLLNRRRFDAELAAAAARTARYGEACSVLVMDLDRMKGVNDELGHAAGDGLLQWVGAILLDRIRASDVGARVGGDEFAVLLTGTGAQAATVLARDLVAEVAGIHIPAAGGGEAWTTVSMGIAQLAADDGDGERAMQRADHAMYRAKRRGGGCVMLAGDAAATASAAAYG
jgi:diguanylate cyclase (GGDEF)-like protein